MAVRSSEHEALGQALRDLRGERGMAQMDLALESGLDRTYVGGIERGERNPSYTSLRRIAAVLDIPVSSWLERAEEIERRRRGGKGPEAT